MSTFWKYGLKTDNGNNQMFDFLQHIDESALVTSELPTVASYAAPDRPTTAFLNDVEKVNLWL